MCGIAGILHYREPSRPVDPGLLQRMADVLRHRGPDGDGVWSAAGIGLAHRRLAILDPSAAARQPMVDTAGPWCLTYNGEIYNYRELREELTARGHRIRSSGDTEVLLAGFREWGRDVVPRLRGIFAFAAWDGRRRELLLARDPLGVKPLFFSDVGGTLRFGSEVKAILVDPAVARDFDPMALDAFFSFSYTPAPRTGFAAVRQLLPGEAAVVSERGMSSWRYWENPYAAEPAAIGFEQAVAEFGQRFDGVVRSQMVSDVGVGAFLSGGIDSAAVVRGMKRAGQGPVQAFAIGFDWEGFDERPRARRSARDLGVELTERTVSPEAADVLPELSRHLEEPTADSSALPVWFLCRGAAEQHKVALSGDGADEILAGYETYRAAALAERYRRLPGPLRRQLVARAVRLLPAGDRKYGLHQRANRFVYAAELGPGRDHCAWRIIFTDDLKQRLYAPDFRRATADHDPIGLYAAHVDAVPPGRERLAGLLHADMAFYLPNDMLVKVDRMSMAHGLEVRVPFLDPEIVGYCASLPADHKLHRGRVRKHLLRESLRGSIDDSVLDAPKSGFNIPVESWMRGRLRDLLFDTVETVRDEIGEFLDVGALPGVADEHARRRADHGHALFTVLMFAMWLTNVRQAWRTSGEGDS
jgi:asparagine synthase (glutamine-hydrolysing)